MSISNFTSTGTLIDQTVSSVSADGLTRTVSTDPTGSGVSYVSETDVTVLNADGSRTATVTDYNSKGSMSDQTVTTTSANGLDIVKSVDSAGNGVFNLITTTATVNNADGSTTTTQTDTANNGSVLSQTMITVSPAGVATVNDVVNVGGDSINISNGYTLTASNDTVNAAANTAAAIVGTGNTISAGENDTLTLSGGNEGFVFQPAFGADVINGFASTDSMTFSSSDFANWSALLSHMTQSGSNTVITLDASDKITLTGVTESSLKSTQFHFQ